MSEDVDGLPRDRGGRRAGGRTRMAIRRGGIDRPRRLLGCDRGVAAIEFALAAPILLGALVPVADLGIAFAKQQQLRQAVQAGQEAAEVGVIERGAEAFGRQTAAQGRLLA